MSKTPGIRTWSFSRLMDFENCAYRAWLKYGARIPEPERPLPPGKTEHANDRGSRIHLGAELFVKNEAMLLPELKYFETELEKLKRLYAAGKVSLEGEWGFDKDWNPVAWNSADVWCRMKLDALVFLSDTEAVAIDYKTGKKYGKEVTHAEQLQSYQLGTFMRYPKLEVVHTELWYLDQDEMTSMTFTRPQGTRFRKSFDQRAFKLTNATDFPPNANIHSCKWCAYKGTEHCPDSAKVTPFEFMRKK